VLNIDIHIVLSSAGASARITGVASTTMPASAHPDMKRANHNIKKLPATPVRNHAPDQISTLIDIKVYGCQYCDK